ncbi:hypothetical protein WJX73_005725 [Symbiochloris irregularis]|uniref:Ferredoxin thioredoxin reductase alpha chain domain-containing protein n=1 Tax=Symbiochloris irregularis TaxID=706552 RepID=A0AAW1Q2F4_9CHLO
MGGEEGELASDIKEGAKVKVTTDVTVFHVPKQPDYPLKDREGTVLEIVKFFKGSEISANLPYKCLFIDSLEDGKERKVIAHLAANEIELVE